jgi:hypothetical protein
MFFRSRGATSPAAQPICLGREDEGGRSARHVATATRPPNRALATTTAADAAASWMGAAANPTSMGTTTGEPPPQPPPGPPYGQQPGWGPPPRQPAASQGPTQRRLWYQRWWAIGTAGFLLGAIVASAGSSNQKPQTVTETRVTERVVWTPECEKIQNQTERGQCERIMAGYNQSLQSATTIVPTTEPKPEATAPPEPTYTDGTYEVGPEIKPGTYKTRAPAGSPCYWARLGDPDGDQIHANHIGEGPMTLRIRSSDKYVELSGGCEWRKVS